MGRMSEVPRGARYNLIPPLYFRLEYSIKDRFVKVGGGFLVASFPRPGIIPGAKLPVPLSLFGDKPLIGED